MTYDQTVLQLVSVAPGHQNLSELKRSLQPGRLDYTVTAGPSIANGIDSSFDVATITFGAIGPETDRTRISWARAVALSLDTSDEATENIARRRSGAVACVKTSIADCPSEFANALPVRCWLRSATLR